MVRLYVAMNDSLAIAEERPEGWALDIALEGVQGQCVAFDPLQPERVFCGTFDQGLWRSTDAGRTWGRVSEGIAHPAVTSVAVSTLERGSDGGVVYAGTEPTAIFRSEDGGAHWQEASALRQLPSAPTWSFPPRPWTSHARWITPDPVQEGRLFLCAEAGALLRSVDGGQSWADRVPSGPYDTHTLRAHRKAPDRLYAAAGDGYSRPGNGYAESRDAGAKWQRVGERLRFHYLWGIAVDADDPDVMVVSVAPSPNQAHNPAAAESSIFYRHGGEPWQEAAGLPPARGTVIPVVEADPVQAGRFYAASNHGLFRSDDGGAHWSALPVAWPEHYRRQHVQGVAVRAS